MRPDDSIERAIRRALLPHECEREILNARLSALDQLLERGGARGKQTPPWGPDLDVLRTAKAEAEALVRCGRHACQAAVLAPVALFGIARGFRTPDLDIRMLGIGRHRYFLFHSALGLAVLRYLYLTWERSAHARPGASGGWLGHAWRKVSGVLLGSYALGVAVHLGTDALQPKSVVFPFFGSLVHGTLVDDEVWLLGNAVWAFRVAGEVFALTLAEELATAKRCVSRYFSQVNASHFGVVGRVVAHGHHAATTRN